MDPPAPPKKRGPKPKGDRPLTNAERGRPRSRAWGELTPMTSDKDQTHDHLRGVQTGEDNPRLLPRGASS